MATRIQRRYQKIDGWRGYYIPGTAVAGSSDTGEYSDSPAPSHEVKAEIRRFQRECLRPAGIKSRQRWGVSSNVFCAKRWVCVAPEDFYRAAELATEWLDNNRINTRYIHDAKLDEVLTQHQQSVVQS